ncbi:unnamed protein product [Meloidogyne enterolobii]|uniref:Uncharacterized protein n=1 Tax=Meloidogyne enterolobii TaxID=390850 RepID=A0ACB0ZPS2_MELEN
MGSLIKTGFSYFLYENQVRIVSKARIRSGSDIKNGIILPLKMGKVNQKIWVGNYQKCKFLSHTTSKILKIFSFGAKKGILLIKLN